MLHSCSGFVAREGTAMSYLWRDFAVQAAARPYRSDLRTAYRMEPALTRRDSRATGAAAAVAAPAVTGLPAHHPLDTRDRIQAAPVQPRRRA
jgi:hypothetical protein